MTQVVAHYHYRFAGLNIQANRPLTLSESCFDEGRPALESPSGLAEAAGDLLFRGEAWVGGHWRLTECRRQSRGYRLEVAGAAPCVIRDQALHVLPSETASLGATEAALHGPALILALAEGAVFCIHASAVEVSPGSCVAFLGPSGRGKSTLAALLAGHGLRRLVDDTLPVTWDGQGGSAWPRFPQPGEVSPAQLPERLHVRRLYLLDPVETEACEARPMRGAEAVLALAGHTVAARLFRPELLSRHLDFCITIAERVGVRRLLYPRRMDVGPVVAQALRNDLRDGDV